MVKIFDGLGYTSLVGVLDKDDGLFLFRKGDIDLELLYSNCSLRETSGDVGSSLFIFERVYLCAQVYCAILIMASLSY